MFDNYFDNGTLYKTSFGVLFCISIFILGLSPHTLNINQLPSCANTYSMLQDRNFPNTLIEMKRLAEESNRFKVEDIPPRLREKEKLFAVFRDLERQMQQMNFELDRDLYPDNIERSWSQLMMLFQERDQMIHEEIARLEKLQRLAEKIHAEAKQTDTKLDDIEAWIEDEAKRIDHLHPKDAKNNCDQIERELARTEEVIKSMFSDVQILRDNRFSQAHDLHHR